MSLRNSWRPLSRTGTPTLREVANDQTTVSLAVSVRPAPPEEWISHFFDHVSQSVGTGVLGYSMIGGGGITVRGKIGEASIGEVIAAIDASIDAANDKYENVVIPAYEAAEAEAAKKAQAEKARQDKLDAVASQFTKPELPPTPPRSSHPW